VAFSQGRSIDSVIKSEAAMRYEIRELNVGGILDQAIGLTKDHFWLYFKIFCVMFLPFTILSNLIVQWNMPDIPAVMTPEMYRSYSTSVPWGLISSLSLVNFVLIYPITDAALIYAIANSYLQKPISVGGAFRRAFHIFLPLVGTWILMCLAISLGFLLLIVGAIIFSYWFVLSTRIVVIEGTAGFAALKRSKQLTKGSGNTFVILAVLVFVISAAINFVTGFIHQAELKIVVGAICQTIAAIFGAAAWVVFYFSCRCKVENFDLQMLAESVGKDEPDALSSGAQ
jgi:hypothetical protein